MDVYVCVFVCMCMCACVCVCMGEVQCSTDQDGSFSPRLSFLSLLLQALSGVSEAKLAEECWLMPFCLNSLTSTTTREGDLKCL